MGRGASATTENLRTGKWQLDGSSLEKRKQNESVFTFAGLASENIAWIDAKAKPRKVGGYKASLIKGDKRQFYWRTYLVTDNGRSS